jgi:hypothetical protein
MIEDCKTYPSLLSEIMLSLSKLSHLLRQLLIAFPSHQTVIPRRLRRPHWPWAFVLLPVGSHSCGVLGFLNGNLAFLGELSHGIYQGQVLLVTPSFDPDR